MKCTIIITLFVAFLAVTHGAPAKVPDWTAIEKKLEQFETIAQDAIKQVSDIAKKENPAVGAEIEKDLLAKADEVKAVVQKAFTAVKEKNLTEEKAKEYLQEVSKLLAEGREKIKGNFQKLSGSSRTQIFGAFFKAILDSGRRAKEIYDNLQK